VTRRHVNVRAATGCSQHDSRSRDIETAGPTALRDLKILIGDGNQGDPCRRNVVIRDGELESRGALVFAGVRQRKPGGVGRRTPGAVAIN
jgi:hypothetical protein